MLALIDADILLYQMGSATDDEGHPLAWNLVKMRVDERIHFIMTKSGCDKYKLYLTGKSNFRIKEATILPYKGNRLSEKPYWHGKIKEYFMESNKHKNNFDYSKYYEADDALSMKLYADLKRISNGWTDKESEREEPSSMYESWDDFYEHYASCVLDTIDKDMDMCPGKHGKWHKNKKTKELEFTCYTVTDDEGIWWFYRQLLTGDMTDNILGLFGIGPVSAKKSLKGLTEPLDLYTVVQKKYEERFGNYWEMFLHENARLLWMLRYEGDDIRIDLKALEVKRLLKIEQDKEF